MILAKLFFTHDSLLKSFVKCIFIMGTMNVNNQAASIVKYSSNIDRRLPSLPNPISLIPISPDFSSNFALCRLAPTHFALYHFASVPTRPIIFLPTYHFALFPIRPMLSRPFTISSNTILPIYYLASVSFHHSVSVSLKLLTTAHDFLVLEPRQLPGTG